jgi:hypothetical protein
MIHREQLVSAHSLVQYVATYFFENMIILSTGLDAVFEVVSKYFFVSFNVCKIRAQTQLIYQSTL